MFGAKLKDGLLALLAAGDKAECAPRRLASSTSACTGTLTPAMVACVKDADDSGHEALLTQAEACFKEAQGDGEGLTYSKFAERFVDPYLGARHNTFGVHDIGDAVREAVRKSFDLDGDQDIDWDEYLAGLGAAEHAGRHHASTTCSRPSSGAGSCPG